MRAASVPVVGPAPTAYLAGSDYFRSDKVMRDSEFARLTHWRSRSRNACRNHLSWRSFRIRSLRPCCGLAFTVSSGSCKGATGRLDGLGIWPESDRSSMDEVCASEMPSSQRNLAVGVPPTGTAEGGPA
jgi:hypothetical protein